MTIFEFMLKKLSARRKRRQLRDAREFLAQIRDQIHSGQTVERQWQRKVQMLEAQLFALEPPDDIVRRSGAGA